MARFLILCTCLCASWLVTLAQPADPMQTQRQRLDYLHQQLLQPSSDNPVNLLRDAGQLLHLVESLKPQAKQQPGLDLDKLARYQVDALLTMGSAYEDLEDYRQAVRNYRSAQRLAARHRYEQGDARATEALAALDKSERLDATATRWGRETFDRLNQWIEEGNFDEKIRDQTEVIVGESFLALAEAAAKQGDAETALEFYQSALTYYQNDRAQQAKIHREIGRLQAQLGRHAEAQASYDRADEAEAVRRADSLPAIEPPARERVEADLQRLQRDLEVLAVGPMVTVKPASPAAPSRPSPQPRPEAPRLYLEQAETLAKEGRYEESVEQFKQYAVLQQQLYDVRSDSLYMANLIDNQLREIEILRQEHQLKEQEIQAAALRMERNRVVRNSLIGGIGLVLAILGLLTYLFVSKRRSHRQLVAAYADLEITHRQLKMAQSQLVASEKMASLGQLTAGIAHEINNPVNFIAGNVVPLRNDLQDLLRVVDAYEQEIDEKGLEGAFPRTQALKQAVEVDYLRQEIPELMDGIEEGARRTTEIVRGLRVFARLDEDAVKRFDLHSGLDSTLTLVRNHAHKVEFVRHYGDLPLVEGFPGKLNQVFMNLLTNALQALPEEGGTITLTTLSHGLEVEIRVQDNGCGIPPEVRTRMFEPFYTTKEVGEGTGLGLAITLGIIKQHKGQIEIESEAGEGTTVIIRLPVDFIGDLEGEAPERMPSSGQVIHKA